ncbi:hypothetical protein [Rugamonas apoptosis]|uniref:Uncharacterized protein n=1 Tax=Rugamonas apoptosis TaxID=2758570 RepID=A0A7W2F8A3_9BURK|nr:hypothetical protein [Rugamonas apoptosis]MBA5686962.1 hypothetical protein [Rugamonas apoptosis]
MMNQFSNADAIAGTTVQPLTQHKNSLEDNYMSFWESTIQQNKEASPNAGLLMERLNRIQQLCAGMGVVMRIVGGNPVLEDCYNPEDASEPPLSNTAISALTNMVATVCEGISEDIALTADKLNEQVRA